MLPYRKKRSIALAGVIPFLVLAWLLLFIGMNWSCFVPTAEAQTDFSTLTYGDITLTLDSDKFAVKFKSGAAKSDVDALNLSYGALLEEIKRSDLKIVTVSKDMDAITLRDIYAQHPSVEYANPVYFRADLLRKTRGTFGDELLVRLKRGASETVLNQVNSQYGLEELKTIGSRKVRIKVLRAIPPFRAPLLELVEIYSQLPYVEYAEPNWIQLNPALLQGPEDPYFDGDYDADGYPDQWGLHQGSDAPHPDCDIDAPEAWSMTTGNASVIIAILDTGIFLSEGGEPYPYNLHPDFYDYPSGRTKLVPESKWYNAYTGGHDVMGYNSHGTEVAGVAGAAVNNKDDEGNFEGIVSLAWDWDVKIMPILAHLTNLSHIISGLGWAIDEGADVINMSWFWDLTKGNFDAVLREAYEDAGCFLVAACGNDGVEPITYPASSPYVLAVGASVEDDTRWTSSNYGDGLDVVAPGGHNVCTTSIRFHGTPHIPHEPIYRWDWYGTSASVPLVSGLAALLLSWKPTLTNIELMEIIPRSAEKVRQDIYSYSQTEDFGSWDSEMGYGRINAYWALLEAGAGIKADLNNDEDIDVLDLQIMIPIVLGQVEPDDYEQWAGDLNYDGDIDVLDLQLLLQIIMGERGGPDLPENASEPAVVYLSKAPGRTGEYEVMLEKDLYVAGVQLTISYNPLAMKPGVPQTTKRSAGFELAYAIKEGELKILLYSTAGDFLAPETGSIIHIPLESSGRVNSKITDALLARIDGQEYPVTIRSMGPLKVADQQLPGTYMLFQNYPNPFNPNTEISFALPMAAYATLRIYDILGREVATLVGDSKEAGYHTVTWDGRNIDGREVASGVYFYLLVAGDFQETKRMLLLK